MKRFELLTLDLLLKKYYDQKKKEFTPINMYISQNPDPNKYPPEYEDYEIELNIWKKKSRLKRGKKPKKPELSSNIDDLFETEFKPDDILSKYNYKTQKEKKYPKWFSKYLKDNSKKKEILQSKDGDIFFIYGKIKWDKDDEFEEAGMSICQNYDHNSRKLTNELIISNNCNTMDYSYVKPF